MVSRVAWGLGLLASRPRPNPERVGKRVILETVRSRRPVPTGAQSVRLELGCRAVWGRRRFHRSSRGQIRVTDRLGRVGDGFGLPSAGGQGGVVGSRGSSSVAAFAWEHLYTTGDGVGPVPRAGWMVLAGFQEMNLQLKQRFNDAGIDFAFPTQTVRLQQESAWRMASSSDPTADGVPPE